MLKSHSLCAVVLILGGAFPPFASSQQPGKFDYYLLSMSWSPEFCYGHRDNPECSEHLGLVVHGLWPQYNGAGRGPEDCGHEPGPANPSSLLDIMPTTSLVEHEWATHGTCSGLSAENYFGLMRRIFSNFHIPPQLQHPNHQFITRTSQLKHAIEQSNPGLNDSEIVLTCTGPYLKEIELCVTKDGHPQSCSNLRGCGGTSLRVPPVR
jgi:ribonuclease T2